MQFLNVAAFIKCTEVEGPGKRFALWVQGCNIRCPGCCNPEMQDFVPRKIMNWEEMVMLMLNSKDDSQIEGVTFLGGEPMLQAQGLSLIAEICRQKELSVMVFTGYTMKMLNKLNLPGVDRLLSYTDILVDGPFKENKLDKNRNWAGSSNQKFHYLTSRYRKGIEYDPSYCHGSEIRITGWNEVLINGAPTGIKL